MSRAAECVLPSARVVACGGMEWTAGVSAGKMQGAGLSTIGLRTRNIAKMCDIVVCRVPRGAKERGAPNRPSQSRHDLSSPHLCGGVALRPDEEQRQRPRLVRPLVGGGERHRSSPTKPAEKANARTGRATLASLQRRSHPGRAHLRLGSIPLARGMASRRSRQTLSSFLTLRNCDRDQREGGVGKWGGGR